MDGPQRELLQGMIQIAAACHHLSQGNRAGATYLYDRGRARLTAWLPGVAGISLASWIVELDEQFAALQAGREAIRQPKLTIAP